MSAVSADESENCHANNCSVDATSKGGGNDNKMKLVDLKVTDLKAELEKRDLDKTGVKSVLIERLKNALLQEGEDPEEFTFIVLSDPVSSKSPSKKKKIPESETNGEVATASQDVVENASLRSREVVENTHARPEVVENASLTSQEVLKDASLETKESAASCEDKNGYDVTLQLSIDEEEAQLNDDENMELSKTVETFVKPPVEPTVKTICDSSAEESAPTKAEEIQIQDASKITKIATTDPNEKISKTPISAKASETPSTVAQKILKAFGKSDKIKNASVLAKSLWITGLPNTTRAADLKAIFSKQGRVLSVKIVKSTKQTPGKCYGFVTMAASKDATKAIQNLHRTELNGRTISVERTQSEPSVLLKKSESKLITPSTKKPIVKKELVKTTESVKLTSAPESKVTIKHEAKAKEPKPTSDPEKPKVEKIKVSEKAKSKEKEQKPRDHKEKDVRHTSIKRAAVHRPRSTAFNEKPRSAPPRMSCVPKPYVSRIAPRPRIGNSLLERAREDRLRRERLRDRERREAERKRELEISRHRFIERKQREEAFRLEKEKEKLRLEREMLERERAEMLKLERERQRLERLRLEREREELRRQAELRRSATKRPLPRVSREAEPYWEEPKKLPRFEERSGYHGDKLRLTASVSTPYAYSSRDRAGFGRHELQRHPERYSAPKASPPVVRREFDDRDSRREVTIRGREDRQVYDRTNYRDRDTRTSLPSREKERHSTRREAPRDEWKHERRVHERIIAPSTSSSGQRRMTYY